MRPARRSSPARTPRQASPPGRPPRVAPAAAARRLPGQPRFAPGSAGSRPRGTRARRCRSRGPGRVAAPPPGARAAPAPSGLEPGRPRAASAPSGGQWSIATTAERASGRAGVGTTRSTIAQCGERDDARSPAAPDSDVHPTGGARRSDMMWPTLLSFEHQASRRCFANSLKALDRPRGALCSHRIAGASRGAGPGLGVLGHRPGTQHAISLLAVAALARRLA